jgi:L-rhamnose mutarotase
MECLARLAPRSVTSTETGRYAFVTRLKRGTHSALRAALSKTPPQIAGAIARAHFRNVHIYLHHGRLYVYAEYTGSTIEADAHHLRRSGAFVRWRAAIEKHCRPDPVWEQMQEVFHTH